MMTADVVEGAQLLVGAANDKQRLTRQFHSDESTRLPQLIQARDDLPGSSEDYPPLQFGDAFVHVPRSGNSGRLIERLLIVVGREDVVQRLISRLSRFGCGRT